MSWARLRGDVRAAAVIGSRARSLKPADRWSDVDILILATNPRRYLSDVSWLQTLGNPWLTYVEPLPAGGGRGERRVLFPGALEVDFAILASREFRAARLLLPVARRMPGLLPASVRTGLVSMQDVLARGIRVLVDKDGILSRLASGSLDVPAWVPPSLDVFLEEVSRFWHGPVWTAKHLRRGELWRAKDACDNRMKTPLLRMIEWHARVTKGSECETWTLGRFIEEWADPRVIEQLSRTFAHYDEEDVWHALLETMDLFRRVAQETANGLGFRYPQALDREVTRWVQACYSERGQDRQAT